MLRSKTVGQIDPGTIEPGMPFIPYVRQFPTKDGHEEVLLHGAVPNPSQDTGDRDPIPERATRALMRGSLIAGPPDNRRQSVRHNNRAVHQSRSVLGRQLHQF